MDLFNVMLSNSITILLYINQRVHASSRHGPNGAVRQGVFLFLFGNDHRIRSTLCIWKPYIRVIYEG